MIHDNGATPIPAASDCGCKHKANGLGFIGIPQPSIDWKLIAIIALVAFIIFQQMTKPERSRRYARR